MPSTTNTKHRVTFFGSSPSSALILEDLLNATSLEVVAVVTQPAKPHAHAHQQLSRVARLAQEHNIKLFTPHKLSEVTQALTELKPTAGVLFAYGKILPDETLNLFPHGIINIHPSLLPKHRGPAPLENTILAGDSTVGTSIMLITPEMDVGPILAQHSFKIHDDITKQDLWEQLLHVSRKLLLPTLLDYLAGNIKPEPQDSAIKATYSHIIKKSDGDIDPHTTSAQQLTRLVRAYAGWPGVRIPILLRGKPQSLTLHEIKLSEAQASQSPELACENKQLYLHLKDGTVEILRAQLPNKSIVTGRDLCNTGQITLA